MVPRHMRCKPKFAGLGQYNNFRLNLVTCHCCPLQSSLPQSLYTGHSASPTAGNISGTPVVSCYGAPPVTGLESLPYPSVFSLLRRCSTLGTGRCHKEAQKGSLSFLVRFWRCCAGHLSADGACFVTIWLKCINMCHLIGLHCYQHC
jgi:hypothetical protein